MPEFQVVKLSEAAQGLFSAEDVERLMRAEFDRAVRHKFSLVVMLVGVDRLGQLHDLYGWESKDEILKAVVSMLRGSLRDSDLLGLTQDDRILLVFPHTTPESAGLLARRMLAGARKLRFDRDGRTLRISLSIGVANNRAGLDLSFETLVAVAEDGLTVADGAGGDRFVETELYQLYEKKRRAKQRAREGAGLAPEEPARIVAFVPPPESQPGAAPRLTPDDPIGQALLELLAQQGFEGGNFVGVDPEAVATAIRRANEAKLVPAVPHHEPATPEELREKQRQIEILERRIAKLTQALGLTEEELRRVASLKGVDFGLPSIYKTVQGLSGAEPEFERKKVMMLTILEANLALKRELER
ncbi:MAG: diguanylate cyclase [Planctomycetes bacterium]|nr:diguanylate cyclase [Planctomycetota bacterium]